MKAVFAVALLVLSVLWANQYRAHKELRQEHDQLVAATRTYVQLTYNVQVDHWLENIKPKQWRDGSPEEIREMFRYWEKLEAINRED